MSTGEIAQPPPTVLSPPDPAELLDVLWCEVHLEECTGVDLQQ